MILMAAALRPRFRRYRLAAALDRLRDMPAGTRVSVAWAARLLHIPEARMQELVRRYGGEIAPDATINIATLRYVIRRAHDAQT